jgi:hypothetical protein
MHERACFRFFSASGSANFLPAGTAASIDSVFLFVCLLLISLSGFLLQLLFVCRQ